MGLQIWKRFLKRADALLKFKFLVTHHRHNSFELVALRDQNYGSSKKSKE
jgi:hypothetical protein